MFAAFQSNRIVQLVFALFCIVAIALLIIPIVEWKSTTIAQRDQLVLDHANLTERSQKLRQDVASYAGDDLGQVTAQVQTTLNALSQNSGIALRSIGPVTPRDQSLGTVVGFRLEFEAGLDQLTAFLREIEYHTPALVVANGTLRRIVRPGDTAAQPRLFAQLVLTAPIQLPSGAEEP